jgi:hypothetical protein
MGPTKNYDDHIDEQIKKAQAEGAFDNLRGKGKPLSHLDTDPLANVLRAQGFTPRWVERDHDIRQKTEIAEQAIKRTYQWVMHSWSSGSVDRRFARDEWRKAQRIFRERLDEINTLIRTYNLEVPPTVGQKFVLKEEEELERLGLTGEIGA